MKRWLSWFVIPAACSLQGGDAPAGESPPPAPAPAVAPDWSALDWGAPLPDGLTPENDWPWVPLSGSTCGWDGPLLLCDDGVGLERAYVEAAAAVEGRRIWLRCAGLEWCAGDLAEEALELADGRVVTLGRWARAAPAGVGWAWAEIGPSRHGASGDALGAPSALEGGEAWGAHRAALSARIGGCAGAASLERFPAQVIYAGGEAVKVRLQGFPPDAVDAACLARALGAAPAPAETRSVEVMLGAAG